MNIECYNHYPAPIDYEPNSMRKLIKRALKQLVNDGLIQPISHLDDLKEIEFNLVDDPTISELHDKYMEDPTPTDVITFHHGEVFVSYDTAVREAKARNITLSEELSRYHIHGLLHLAGYDDLNEDDYTAMHKLQERLVYELHE